MSTEYPYMAWKEGGVWTAHAPAIPGAYGLGATQREAASDLREAISLALAYREEQSVARLPAPPSAFGTIRVRAR